MFLNKKSYFTVVGQYYNLIIYRSSYKVRQLVINSLDSGAFNFTTLREGLLNQDYLL